MTRNQKAVSTRYVEGGYGGTLRLIVRLLVALCLVPALSFAQGTITPTPFQVVFDNAGAIVSGACIWTYQAGTTTPATTYSNVTETTENTNPIIADSAGRYTAFLTPGTSYKFVYETACVAPSHGTVLRTADNITAVPSNSGGVDVVGTAGEALSAGDAVYLSDGSGSKTAGDWYEADNTNAYSSTTNPVGMVTAAIASGSTGTVRMVGSVTGLSSLTIGLDYYIGTSGAITSTAPSSNVKRLGKADTTSSLVLTPDPTSLAGSLKVTGDVYTTAWTDYGSSSTVGGFSGTPTVHIYYQKVGNLVYVAFSISGTSNATTLTFTLPYTSAASGPSDYRGALGYTVDSGADSAAGRWQLPTGSSTVTCVKSAGGAWTNSGSKEVRGQFFYEAQ